MRTLDDLLNNEYKVYVWVNEDRQADGTVMPKSFIWVEDNGNELYCEIVDVESVERKYSRRAGGYGVRYTVIFCIDDEPQTYRKFMFYERGIGKQNDRWFMERKLES